MHQSVFCFFTGVETTDSSKLPRNHVDISTRCTAKQLYEIYKIVSKEDHKRIITSTCFGPLFEGPLVEANVALISVLVDIWNESEACFRYGDVHLELTAEHVSHILGLPNEGVEVQLKDDQDYAPWVRKWVPRGRVDRPTIVGVLRKIAASRAAEDEADFARFMIFLLFTSVLFQRSNYTCSANLSYYLEDLEDVNNYKWSDVIHRFLLKSVNDVHLRTTTKKNRQAGRVTYINGAAFVLSAWFYDITASEEWIDPRPCICRWVLTPCHKAPTYRRQVATLTAAQSSVISVCDTVTSLLSPDDEIIELNNLVERLERLASNVGSFIQLSSLEVQSQKHFDISEQRTTSSFLPFEHSFVGRVKEKENIIKILRSTELRGTTNIPVLPILGIGGVGKTTLAQVVYNDEEVKGHFSLKVWVCVSDSFDVKRLIREILDQSRCDPRRYGSLTNLTELQKVLRDTLSSKKFLLVLDDVWNETNRNVWDALKTPLGYGKDGSMILLTTRLSKVAKLMGTLDPIELEGLPEDEYLSFFKEQSFGGYNPEEHPRLVAIGKKIASKLKGSPLAAKTMGALLNDKLDVHHWESISKSEIWELENGQDGIMAALKLSYLHLPPHLRQCFAYLSIYPKDQQFKRDYVIRMWMAQGMIHHDSRIKTIEDVGKDYFNELISKSFFQPVKYYTDKYIIHDLLHDLAESVSKHDCFRIDGDEFRTIPTSIRHLYLNEKHLPRLKENTVVLGKLRTLILYGNLLPSPNDADLQDVLIQLRKIRLLALRQGNLQKCPDNLSRLIHLHYLDLSCSRIREMPEELPKLYHLQTLELCKLRLDCALAGITNLINLRHFICDEDIVSKVPGIGKLTCLQMLPMFRIQRDPEFQIVQLKYLRELCGRLTINNLDCVDSKEEAEEARLYEKGNLEELCLEWDNERNVKPDEVENGILEGLRPNPNLKWLKIDGYRGTLSPSWMVRNHLLINLASLTISKCRAWKELPPLGQLLCLKKLEMCGMDAVKEVGIGFHGTYGFQSLQSLELEDFPQLEEWYADEDFFPRLQYFRIEGCPRLKSIPPLPTTLEELKVEDVGLTILPNLQMASSRPSDSLPSSSISSSSSSLKSLTITKCIYLTSVGEWFLQYHNILRHLLQVNIEHFYGRCDEHFDIHSDKWKPLSFSGFSKLIALEMLGIGYCNIFVPSDTEEDSGLLPPSLKYFHLENGFVADDIMSKCLQGLSSLESLKISNIPKITTISFPEGLTRLKKLDICICEELSSIPSFKSVSSIEDLSIICCPQITTITGFEQLAQLKSLIIGSCKELSSIHGFEGLSSLKTLNVYGCSKITIIIGLEQLTQLKEFKIHHCKELSSLPGLESLPMLKRLDVYDCPKLSPEEKDGIRRIKGR